MTAKEFKELKSRIIVMEPETYRSSKRLDPAGISINPKPVKPRACFPNPMHRLASLQALLISQANQLTLTILESKDTGEIDMEKVVDLRNKILDTTILIHNLPKTERA